MSRPLAAVALVAVLLTAAPAAAAVPGLVLSPVRVDAAGRSADVTVRATGFAPGVGLDPASVLATVDGRDLVASAVVGESEQVTEAPRVLLVVDTSGSMQGAPMAEAKQAISAFVADVDPRVELGLLRFSSEPSLVVEPTLDRTRLLGAVSTLEAQGETALYDAVQAGVAALGPQGDRRLVVLSDGGDTRSGASLEQAMGAASSSGATVDAIGFRTDESVQDVLQQLAASGRGQVHTAASAAQLSAALATSTRVSATTLTVRILLPEDLTGRRDLALTVATPRGVLTSTTELAFAGAGVTAVSNGWWGTRSALLAGLAALAGGLLLGVLTLFGGRGRDRRKVQSVLDRYTTAPAPEKESLRTASPVTRRALEVADKVATNRGLQDRLSLKLDRAAIAMTPAEWLLLKAGVAMGLSLLLVLLGWNLFLALLVGVGLGVVGTNAYLKSRGRRRQKAFEERLPDALQMAAGGLSAGYSLAQALDGIVREGSEPMATELGRALAESRLGVPVETTLDTVATRMGSKDFGWVVMAIRVQREVGGNLAGVLSTVSATMRERAMLRRHVRGLSAEGRLSAYILLGLPVFLALYMLTLRREYIEPLYTTGLGIVLIVVALLLMTIGSFVMSRMVKVEV